MAKDANRKIAEWIGWKWKTPSKGQTWDPYFEDESGDSRRYPFFCECDTDSIMLLPVLVSRGYWVELKHYRSSGWKLDCGIYREGTYFGPNHSTIAAAITAAVMQLIEPI